MTTLPSLDQLPTLDGRAQPYRCVFNAVNSTSAVPTSNSGGFERWRCRHLVPRPTVEDSARLLLLDAAPLFEEKWHTGFLALVAEIDDPLRVHRPRTRSRLTAHDHPIHAGEIEVRQRAKQRLERQELDHRARVAEMIDAESVIIVFDADTHPDVAGPVQLLAQARQPIRPLGQKLEPMPVGAAHHAEHSLDERGGHVLVKEVAHGVDENDLRFLPAQRQFQDVIMDGEFEAVHVVRLPHRLQAKRHAFRVTVFAARTDLGATRCRIPRRFRPFDG